MSYVVKSGTTDISDYVIDCSTVPAVQRNRNFEPILGEVSMVITEKITSSSLVNPGSTIKIYSSSLLSYPFYIGIVSEKKYSKSDRCYYVQIRSKLSILQNQLINYNNLHGSLVAGATDQQYLNPDNQGYASVQLLWILEKMFEIVGIEVSLPSASTLIETINFGGVDRDIELQHLRLDENMLYAINQNQASNHTPIDGQPDKRVLVPTFWDFFVWFCGSIGPVASNNIGYNIRWSVSGTAETLELFVRDDSEITVADDNNYSEDNSNIVGDEGGCSWSVLCRSRSYYDGSDEYDLKEVADYSGDGKSSVMIPNNLVIFYEKWWEADGYIIGFVSSQNSGSLIVGRTYNIATYNSGDDFTNVGAPSNTQGIWFRATGTGPTNWTNGSELEKLFAYCYPPSSFAYNKIRDAIGDFDSNTFLTDSSIVTRAKEINIDLAEQTAEILQEVE